METFDAVMIVEGSQEVATLEEYLAAAQHLLDTGVCWQLQGFFGRTIKALIEQGYISNE